MRLENVLALTNGVLLNDPFVKQFNNIIVDASGVRRGDLFIAFDTTQIDEAILNGAYGIVFESMFEISDDEIAWVQVKEIQNAHTRLLRFRLIEQEIIAYECNDIILKLSQQITTDSNFVTLQNNFNIIHNQLWNIPKNAIVLYSKTICDSNFFTNTKPMPKLQMSHINVVEKTLFETSFIYNNTYYEREPLSPFFIPYLEELFHLYKTLNVNFHLKKFSPIKHFEAVFVNKNAQIKEFGTSDKVVIFEPFMHLIESEIEFLHNNAGWANIIYLLPKGLEVIHGEDVFSYSDISKIPEILKNYTFNFALVVGADKSILSQHNKPKQLTLDIL